MKKKWVILGATLILAFTATLLLFIATLVLVCYEDYTQSQKPVQSAINAPQTQIVPLNADKILELVNIERAKVGVAPLTSDPRLIATAQTRADDMVNRNYFSHNDPYTGESLVKIKPTNPQCVYAGENIAGYYKSNESVVAGWMGSKAHHDAMLDPKYSTTGLAANGDIVVQHFCQV